MIKKKSLIFGALALSAMVPVAIATSCGGSDNKVPEKKPGDGEKKPNPLTDPYATLANPQFKSYRFDQNEDGKLAFGVTFGETSPQYRTLATVIERYNDEMKNEPGYIFMEIKQLGSGYSGGKNYVETNVKSKLKDGFINLIANYAPVASLLAKNGMLLNFNDKDEKVATKLSAFSEYVTTNNSNTTNITNTKGTWLIPGFKSVNVTGINGAVFGYVVEKLVGLGAKVDPAFQPFVDGAIAKSQNDRARVIELWGDVVQGIDTTPYKSLVISEDTFVSFANQLEFIRLAQLAFVNSSKPNSQVHMMGIDDAAGFLQTVGFGSIDAKWSENFSKIATKDGNRVVDYSAFKSTETRISKNFSDIFDEMKKAMSVGALVFTGAGEYASNDAVLHKYAMSVGSTAGYKYNFKKDTDQSTEFRLTDQAGTKHELGKFVQTLRKSTDPTKPSRIVGRYATPLRYSTDDASTVKKYDYISPDAATDTKLKAAIAQGTASTIFLYVQGNRADDLTKIREAIKGHNDITEVSIGTAKKNGSLTDVYQNYLFIVPDAKLAKYHFVQLNKNTLLNENEFLWKPATSKYLPTDKKSVIYAQGPSIIGIHSTEKEDYATKMFVKWLFTSKKYEWEVRGKSGVTKVQMTPIQFFSDGASYVTPYLGFENDDHSNAANPYLKYAWDAYAKAIKEPNKFALYEEIGDADADNFRSNLTSKYVAVYNNYKNGEAGKVKSYNESIIEPMVSTLPKLFE